MAQVNMSLRIDAELKDAFMAAAKSMDRNGSQLIRDFMRQTVERQHNTWFRDQVAAGRQQLEHGDGHCCKVSDEAAFCLIQRPYISKTLLTRRISPRGSP